MDQMIYSKTQEALQELYNEVTSMDRRLKGLNGSKETMQDMLTNELHKEMITFYCATNGTIRSKLRRMVHKSSM